MASGQQARRDGYRRGASGPASDPACAATGCGRRLRPRQRLPRWNWRLASLLRAEMVRAASNTAGKHVGFGPLAPAVEIQRTPVDEIDAVRIELAAEVPAVPCLELDAADPSAPRPRTCICGSLPRRNRRSENHSRWPGECNSRAGSAPARASSTLHPARLCRRGSSSCARLSRWRAPPGLSPCQRTGTSRSPSSKQSISTCGCSRRSALRSFPRP